ncbi:MAG: 16S rRNA (adenine(1518)-N(6)/adenine(1519)-N(6))-dimethyltransferase RsmA [Clostridiaceae bacterium]|nr:16S rRNA (adenine(1518)-N(6)/adenine(1519)-N(6))-dimethyltransferase RsmA [Clostridiaceae bacterium]
MINTNEILNKYDLRLTKTLGQNFLTDANIIRKIADAAELSEEDLVIEVGPGIGALTVFLAEKAGKVIAIEIDRKLIPALEETTAPYKNIELVHADALKVDIDRLINGWPGRVKVVSNLPYYVTTPIIMMFLEGNYPIERMVLMVQKEVAQRIAARPKTKDYGALSVGVQAQGIPSIMFNVSPNCFIPKPEVDSTVVRIMLTDECRKRITDYKVFHECVRAAFSQRRKTIINSISSSAYLGIDKQTAREILSELDLKEQVRGEELSVDQFILLSNLVAEKRKS